MSDLRRFWVASAVSTGLAVTYVAIVVVVEPGRVVALPFLATTYFGAWVGYALSYVLLTWRTLGRADGSTLRSWLGESRTGRRRRRRAESLAGIGGPAGAVSFCLLALAAVIVATVVPQLRGDPVVLPLAVAVVVTTWVLIVIVFAVHYAREDAQFGGLRFGGGTDLASDQASSPPRFADYVFLAVQISTSYTSADVTVTGPGLRRATITQTLVSFVFNSILIALGRQPDHPERTLTTSRPTTATSGVHSWLSDCIKDQRVRRWIQAEHAAAGADNGRMGLFDRAGLPSADFRSLAVAVGRRVRVLAWAHGAGGPVVGLADRLAVQDSEGWRFVPWHEIAAGGWDSDSGRLRWRLTNGNDGEALLRDPGSLPDLFRERVEASIVVQERLELNRGRAAMIVARRPLDDERAPLLWTVTQHGGSFDTAQIDQADAELVRLRSEYDIA